MTEKFTNKNIKLHRSFDKYLWKNPDLLEQIPNKSIIVLTVKGDAYYNRISRAFPKNYPKKLGNKIVEARKEGSKWKILV